MQRYLTPKEVAAILLISERHVYRVLKSIPRIRIGQELRVGEADLEAWIRRNTLKGWSAPEEASASSKPDWLRPLKPRNKKMP
jgi:excisionase family DNA binding protein